MFLLSALSWTACGAKDSPTAPSAPASDFAAQFDSLWTTFDREYSYFVHKQIDWQALRSIASLRPAIILDVRMNPGGNDALAFEIAGRFARLAMHTGYVRYRNGPAHTDFAAAIQLTVTPHGASQYSGSP